MGSTKVRTIQIFTQLCSNVFYSYQGLPLGTYYYEMLNPDFLLQIVDLLLVYAPAEVLVPFQHMK